MTKKNKTLQKTGIRFLIIFAVILSATIGMAAAAYLQNPLLVREGLEVVPVLQKDGQFLVGKAKEIDPNKKETVSSLLNGEEILEEEKEKVIAVMVENHPSSRPLHTGFKEAGIVYETLVEGGITRFMLLFSNNYPSKVGPVRSARPYFVSWAGEYPAVYVHAGGSEAALTKLYASNLIDADEGTKGTFRDFAYSAPHNFFADLEELKENMENENWKELKISRFKFCEDKDCNYGEDKVKEVNLAFSSDPAYNVNFSYDAENNVYLRKIAGLKHLDYGANEQISTKNLIVMYAPYDVIDDIGRLEMQTVGEGGADFFINGKHFEGTWEKDSPSSQTVFKDKDGFEVEFLPGKIWIAVLYSDTFLSFK